MKNCITTALLSSLLLSGCGDSGSSSSDKKVEHVYEKKQLSITAQNTPIVASIIFDLEDFARAPLDMYNDPYNPPTITIPNMARTEELLVSEQFKGDFIFDANDEAEVLCDNGELYNEQSTYSVVEHEHIVTNNAQQAILSYWFVANHCHRLTGEIDNNGLAEITGAIWFTAQWVKGLDGQLANFNGVVKTAHASTAPQGVDIPVYYPHLFINYGAHNEVRFDEVNTNMMISGDQFALHYGKIKLYSEFNGRGGSLTIKTIEDQPIILADRYTKHEYVSGQVLIEADDNTQMLLTMDESAVNVDVTLANGDSFETSYSYSELYDLYEAPVVLE